MKAARILNKTQSYDVIVVRGFDIAVKMLERPWLLKKSWLYLTDIPQVLEDYSAEQREQIAQLALGAARIMCQTEELRSLWTHLVPNIDPGKLCTYAPLVPDFSPTSPPIADREMTAVYAGKFKPAWNTLEMAEQWTKLHPRIPSSRFRVFGDKFNADSPDFVLKMRTALNETVGLEWVGAISREELQEELRRTRVGLSWRAETMDSSLEFSTKLLEYGAAGCAAIVNRNSLHESLLGSDYPLYANSAREFLAKLELALTSDEVAQASADRLRTVATTHTFSNRVETVKKWLELSPQQPLPRAAVHEQPLNVLVAGHDLKFFHGLQHSLEASGDFKFHVDEWSGHAKHDSAQSKRKLARADIVFCEWALGNLEWYSHMRLPHQSLVARFHLQERALPYLARSKWDRIDHISYVSDIVRRQGQESFGFPENRTSVIPNYLDPERFYPKKKTGDAKYTLGLIGAVPSRKRLDRALDVLEILQASDTRYQLRVKGKHPLEYGWLLSRREELQFYRRVFMRLNSSPVLAHNVVFDPPGDDVNDWFTMVGHLLSPSDFESFHMAVGEALLAGTNPVVWDWQGAAEIWGDHLVVGDSSDAARRILAGENEQEIVLPAAYQASRVVEAWRETLIGLSGRPRRSQR
ncbi:glycosyltransferase family protein [Arthrobacter sulfonylureivorans]|uniref:Glycosyltransferase n=1 Tax=Arthrobacter sulfonylureivorans TaxID=2486855 RepID=A0ABY3WEE9_9MICC|nr:glycosyltransferase [Arthrobacter sulfonylureivorans]UNK47585.1 glycosyltransferase [Arthrobacter sulfonylureivorans]